MDTSDICADSTAQYCRKRRTQQQEQSSGVLWDSPPTLLLVLALTRSVREEQESRWLLVRRRGVQDCNVATVRNSIATCRYCVLNRSNYSH